MRERPAHHVVVADRRLRRPGVREPRRRCAHEAAEPAAGVRRARTAPVDAPYTANVSAVIASSTFPSMARPPNSQSTPGTPAIGAVAAASGEYTAAAVAQPITDATTHHAALGADTPSIGACA